MSADHLRTKLRSFGRQQRRVDLLSRATLLLTITLAAAGVAIVLDAVFALPRTLRLSIDLLLSTFVLGAGLDMARRWWATVDDPRRWARTIERRLNIHDNRLINAVELAGGGALGSSELASMAIDEGDQLAKQIEPRRAVDREPLHQRLILAGAIGGVMLLTLVAAPRLFTMVVPRYLFPQADLPPFSLVTFDVRIEPGQVRYGQPARIVAKLGGLFAVDHARLVFTDVADRTPLPMIRFSDRQFVFALDRAQQSRRFYIDTPRGRSAEHFLTVLPVPAFEQASVHYDYPEYTGWKSADDPLTERGLHGIAGTQATITVKSNLPLTEARLAFRPADPSVLTPRHFTLTPGDDPHIATATLPLRYSGHFRLTLIGADGTSSEHDLAGPVTVNPDSPPSVQLLEPDLRIAAPAGWQVPVAAAARDDVDVQRLVLHHRVNDAAAVSTELASADHKPGYATARRTLDLDAIAAKPGDTVQAFVTAFDNHNPAQSADSAAVHIRVLSQSEYEKLARQQYGVQQMLAELDAFAARAEALTEKRKELISELESLKKSISERNDEMSESDRQQLAEIQQALTEYARQSRDLADRLQQRADQPPLYAFEPAVQETLADQAARHTQHAKAVERLGDVTSDKLDDALAQLKRQQEAEASDHSQQIKQQLERLALADAMLARGEQIKAIARQQRELEQHLATYQSAGQLTEADRHRLARLGQTQGNLRETLAQAIAGLQQAAQNAGEKLPTMSESASALVQRINELAITSDQQEAAMRAANADGSHAHEYAYLAAGKLETLIGQCNGMGQCASSDLDGTFKLNNSDLAAALNQLAQARAGRGSGMGAASGFSGSGGNPATGSAMSAGGAARPTLVGPHAPSLAAQLQAQLAGDRAAFGRAGDGFSQAGDATQPELMRTEAQRARQQGAAPDGVPLRYRRLTEQYFRRLAQDSRDLPDSK